MNGDQKLKTRFCSFCYEYRVRIYLLIFNKNVENEKPCKIVDDEQNDLKLN